MLSAILFDNWSLELATWILHKDINFKNNTNDDKLIELSQKIDIKQYKINEVFFGERNHTIENLNEDILSIFSLSNLITALILYDEIYYLEDENIGSNYSAWWKKHLTGNQFIFNVIKPKIINWNLKEKIVKYSKRITDDLIKKKPYSSVTCVGAIYYLLLSNIFSLNYQPAPLRADFLKYTKLNDYNQYTIRKELINIVDKQSFEFCKQIKNEFGKSLFDLQVPPITNYVLNQVNSKETILSTTFQIRETKEAKALRKWLDELDLSISNGNLMKFIKEKDSIIELCTNFNKLFNEKKEYNLDVTISFPPAITLPIKYQKNKLNKKTHILFLTDIIKHLYNIRNFSFKVSSLFQIPGEYINYYTKEFINS